MARSRRIYRVRTVEVGEENLEGPLLSVIATAACADLDAKVDSRPSPRQHGVVMRPRLIFTI
jgi:hypothetical protein